MKMNINKIKVDDVIRIKNDISIFVDRSNFNLKSETMRVVHIDHEENVIQLLLSKQYDFLKESNNTIYLDDNECTYSSDLCKLKDIKYTYYYNKSQVFKN